MNAAGTITLFLCGDVMTGRGIDQILPEPVDPGLHEPYVGSALDYLRLAEARSGAIPRPVDPASIWGAALDELARVRPHVRIANLETAVTRSEAWENKGINYRMSPGNVGVLTAAGLDCCVLANNHVLDWGVEGLEETRRTLHEAGIRTAGAGPDEAAATAPAVLPLDDGGRVLVFAFALPDSGVPAHWAASPARPGIAVVNRLDTSVVGWIADLIAAHRRDGDLVVVSLHWGGNFSFEITPAQRAFAHGLIARGGADVVHGHSAHHVKGIEVHGDRPIFYGCGDILNDYEGIAGLGEAFRDDLACLYFPELRRDGGGLAGCRMTPLHLRRFRLARPGPAERKWLRETLARECAPFGVEIVEARDGRLALRWPPG